MLPAPVQEALATPQSRDQLLEVVLDLGRPPEARYPGRALVLGGGYTGGRFACGLAAAGVPVTLTSRQPVSGDGNGGPKIGRAHV